MTSRNIFLGTMLLSLLEATVFSHFHSLAVFDGISLRLLSLYCFLCNFALVQIYSIFIFPFFRHPLRHLPAPRNLNPILGNFLDEFSNPPGGTILKWVNTIPNDGLIRYRSLFNSTQLIATSHEALKSVLSDNPYDWVKPEELVNVLAKVIGHGVILVEGDIHKFQRKHLLPSFRMNHIKQLYPTFWRKAIELTTTLVNEGAVASEMEKVFEVELGAFTTRATLDIIGIAGFGRDFDSLRNPKDELVEKYSWLVEPSSDKAIWFIAHIVMPQWLISRVPWHLTRRVNSIQRELFQFSLDLVSSRRAAFAKDSKLAESMDDILSLLIKSDNFSDEDLANQTLTMMAAGHETTSSALTWVIYLLARHHEIQSRVRDEVRAALPTPQSTEQVSAAQVDALPLLSAVCQETLRLYPTVPVTGRLSIRDTSIGNVRVPKDTFVVLSPWAINRSYEFWGATAEDFVPERWINPDGSNNKNGGAKSNYSQITFLHGPRSCLGQDFAQSELKCLVAALVGRFDFRLARSDRGGQYTPAGVVTTKAAKGMWVKVQEIPGW